MITSHNMEDKRMNIYDFIDQLIKATHNGICKWEDNKDTYRLGLNSGSVTLRVIYDPISDYTRYEIKLFADNECFAVYMAESFDQLYGMLDTLFKAIKEVEQIEIEKKMFNLYSDLKNI